MLTKYNNLSKLRSEIAKLHKEVSEFSYLVQIIDDKPCDDPTKAQAVAELNRVVEKTTKELMDKVNDWCTRQEPGTENFKMGVILRASAIRSCASLETNLARKVEKFRHAIQIVEPFRDTPQGLYPYVNAMTMLYQFLLELTGVSDLDVLLKANETFTNYINTSKERIWDFDCIFDGTPPDAVKSDKAKKFFRLHLAFLLFQHYKNFEPNRKNSNQPVHPKVLEYAIQGLQHLENVKSPAREILCLTDMANMCDVFLLSLRFKQLDHCLAGIMFHTVKYRRSLLGAPCTDVCKIQFQVAKLFTFWGMMIVDRSLAKLTHGEECPIDNEHYEELKLFQEPGVEVYAHQFPVELVGTLEEMKPIMKRVKKWDEKAAVLSAQSGEYTWDAASNLTLVQLYKTFDL